jgi:hypothetical protein
VNALWIGGAPGAGKTTVASRIARKYGFRLYSADTRTWQHRDRALAAGNVAAGRWELLSPDERGALGPEDAVLLGLHRERRAMVYDDVAALPAEPLVVAEGTTLPPDVEPSLWLIPTSEWQRAALEERGLPAHAVAAYAYLRELLASEAPQTLVVDGSRGIDDTVAAVERHFAAMIERAPRARTLDERRSLLREANLAVVAQVRGFYVRPWADGDAEAVEKTFVCECGDAACTDEVVAAVGAAAAAPIVAH